MTIIETFEARLRATISASNAGRRNPDPHLMIALASSPPRNATRSGDLVLPVSMDSAKPPTRNTDQRQSLILHPVQSLRTHRQILRRAALKSP